VRLPCTAAQDRNVLFPQIEITLHDITAGAGAPQVAVFKGHQATVTSLALSQDGLTLASASFDRTIRLWDLANLKEKLVIRGQMGPVLGLATDLASDHLASVGQDGIVRLWNINTGQELATFNNRLPGPLQRTYFTRVALARDGKTIAATTEFAPRDADPRELVIWDVATRQVVARKAVSPARIMCVAFENLGRGSSPRIVATGDDTGMLRLWDAKTGAEVGSMQLPSCITALSFELGGDLLAVGMASTKNNVSVVDYTKLMKKRAP
jgi:WD40 repeat protein